MISPCNAGRGDKEQGKAELEAILARAIDVVNDLQPTLLVAPESAYRDAAYHALDAATLNFETALRFAALALEGPPQ